MHLRSFTLLAGSIAALTIAVAAQQSDTTRNPLGTDAAVVAAGLRLYDQGCAGCHGAAAQGNDRGPALTGRLVQGSKKGDFFHLSGKGLPSTVIISPCELLDL